MQGRKWEETVFSCEMFGFIFQFYYRMHEYSAIIYWEVSNVHSRALHTNETVSAPSWDTNSLTSEYARDELSVKWCGYFQRSLPDVLRETGCLQAEGVSQRGISYWIHNAKEVQQQSVRKMGGQRTDLGKNVKYEYENVNRRKLGKKLLTGNMNRAQNWG